MGASEGTILRGAAAIVNYLCDRGVIVSDRALRGWIYKGTFPANQSQQLGITTTTAQCDQWLEEQAGIGT